MMRLYRPGSGNIRNESAPFQVAVGENAMKMLGPTLTAFLIFLPAMGIAQALEEASIEGQPLVYMKDGKADGCGIRLISIRSDPAGNTGTAWDVSFNFWRSGLATVKGLSYNIDVRAVSAGKKPTNASLAQFWIKAPATIATRPLDNKFHPGEDPGSIIYAVPLDTAIDLFKATVDKQRLTVGIRRTGERGERLYFGEVALTKAEREQVLQCISDVAR